MANFEHEDGPVIDVFDPRCPSRSILRDVTGRWAPLVLMALNDGACRFGELHRTIGGSNERMLSQTLATLTDDKLISRSLDENGRPSYELTDNGRNITYALLGLRDAIATCLWASENNEQSRSVEAE
ncbi:winged helix-turn-helix transcriptional regulator [Ancrocorticia populi]|nr:helix-turn-helix domain-containing protein [Ancrocorticia populi]